MRKSLFILFCALSIADAFGQTDRWGSLRLSKGFLMAHRPTITQLIQGHTAGVEGVYLARSNGSKDWHHTFKGPFQGVAFYAVDLANRKQLGNMYGVYPFVGFPLSQNDRSSLVFNLGCGLSLVERTFNQETNFTNQLVGSQLNVGILTALKYQYTLQRFLIGAGLSFSHASNGSFQLPNLGANVPALDFHLGYRLNRQQVPFELREIPFREKTTTVEMNLSLGFRESNVVTRQKHPVLELRTNYSKPFSKKMSYIIGADLIYNKATYAELDPDSVQILRSVLPGVAGGLSVDMGSAKVFIQAGAYLSTGYQNLGGLYHRFGGQKIIDNKWIISFTLKTHFARADYFALGVGMRLR